LASTIDIAPGHNIGKPKILFRKLENLEIQKQKDKLTKVNPRVKLSEKELLTRNSAKKKTMTEVSFDDFTRLDFRIGRVIKANYLEGSEKLLKVQVNIGKEKRQAIAGLAKHYSPEDLINQLVAVIVNLQPRKIFGEVSEVMLLAAVDGSKVTLLNPDKEVSEGSKVT
jgi:methionine--tRNA ligase beta chain